MAICNTLKPDMNSLCADFPSYPFSCAIRSHTFALAFQLFRTLLILSRTIASIQDPKWQTEKSKVWRNVKTMFRSIKFSKCWKIVLCSYASTSQTIPSNFWENILRSWRLWVLPFIVTVVLYWLCFAISRGTLLLGWCCVGSMDV